MPAENASTKTDDKSPKVETQKVETTKIEVKKAKALTSIQDPKDPKKIYKKGDDLSGLTQSCVEDLVKKSMAEYV